MLSDASSHISLLTARNAHLETTIGQLVAECQDVLQKQQWQEQLIRHAQQASAEQQEQWDRATRDRKEGEALGAQTRCAIQKAVAEAAALPEAERKKKIRSLRLKWHPDKHDLLKEMASEVTKMINEEVEAMEANLGGHDQEATGPGGAGAEA